MFQKILTCVLLFFIHICLPAQILELSEYASGFSKPVDIANNGDDRLFIVEKDGKIRIIKNGVVNAFPFLDIDSKVNSFANERGLLGLAFHPQYSDNGKFFVHYNDNGGDTRISSFQVSADPDIADPDSEQIILSVDQPFSNHNGGDMAFGPDGYLYIGLGDGGSGGDPGNRSQDPENLLGKMLRLDVDGTSNYTIPSSNPFINNADTLDEIWSLGLRNPWRFSFDRLTGDMYIGDVGQDVWEEIDFEPAGDKGGRNYGWRCYEGNAPYNSFNCPDVEFMSFPIHEYFNSPSGEGCSVTGGFVYRGSAYPFLYGKYIFADFCTGKIWSLERDQCGTWKHRELADGASQQYCSFGEDKDGELYLCALGAGKIYKLGTNCAIQTQVMSTPIGCDGSPGYINLSTVGGSGPYSILWSNGLTDDSIQVEEPGVYTFELEDTNGCFTYGCVDIGYILIPEICEIPNTQIFTVCEGESDQVILESCDFTEGNMLVVYLDGFPIDTTESPEITINEEGEYTFQMFNGVCASEVSVPLVVEVIPVGAAPEISWNQTLDTAFVISDIYESYIWSFNDEIQESDGPFIPLNGNKGPITVIGIDAFGCVSAEGGPFFIESIEIPEIFEHLSIYPNPFAEQVMIEIELTESANIDIEIYNTGGKLIYNEYDNLKSSFSRTLNAEIWESGVYILRLKAAEEIMIKKLIKED